MPRDKEVDKCIEEVLEVMNAPCGVLVNEATGKEGLRVKSEVSVGQNWRDMEEVK
jgi:hypothetical protein